MIIGTYYIMAGDLLNYERSYDSREFYLYQRWKF
jgi:hypothetical protein